MLKNFVELIYNVIMSDGMKESPKLDWSKLDIVTNPHGIEENKTVIFIKGDDGGKDYRITVEEIS